MTRVVFVAGMHRSGTTLLARSIESARGASGLDASGVMMGEGQFLQSVYPRDAEVGGPTRWAYDPRSHLTEADAGERDHDDLWRAWSPWWDPTASVLVEKTPSNLTKTRFLAALFPDARFVVITRHPIAQALAVRKWSPDWKGKSGIGFTGLVDHWAYAHELLREDAAHLRHLHVLRFEHLVARPEQELARVSRFLDVDIPPEAARRYDASIVDGYVRDWDRVRRGRAVIDDPRRYKRAARRAIERVAMPVESVRVRGLRDRVAALGYDLEDLRAAAAWPEAVDTDRARRAR